MRISSNSTKSSASRPLLPAYNFSATMAATTSTYRLGAVVSIKFSATMRGRRLSWQSYRIIATRLVIFYSQNAWRARVTNINTAVNTGVQNDTRVHGPYPSSQAVSTAREDPCTEPRSVFFMTGCCDVRGNHPHHKTHPVVVHKNAPKVGGACLTGQTLIGRRQTMKPVSTANELIDAICQNNLSPA